MDDESLRLLDESTQGTCETRHFSSVMGHEGTLDGLSEVFRVIRGCESAVSAFRAAGRVAFRFLVRSSGTPDATSLRSAHSEVIAIRHPARMRRGGAFYVLMANLAAGIPCLTRYRLWFAVSV